MDTVFGDYAHYYDLLYKDKDYTGEAEYIDQLIRKFCPNAKTILELGSGTGRHASLLARKGYAVHGVERSEEMLERSRSLESPGKTSFTQGDIRSARLEKTFDAAMSLFHVVSYQIGNEDVRAALSTARAHLDRDGVFIFDVWYGPAVLSLCPATRVKKVEDEKVEITRVAEPLLLSAENVVEVNYDMFVRDKATGGIREIKEMHRMRYFFVPELTDFLSREGFSLVHAEEWMSGRELDCDVWGACFVARAE